MAPLRMPPPPPLRGMPSIGGSRLGPWGGGGWRPKTLYLIVNFSRGGGSGRPNCNVGLLLRTIPCDMALLIFSNRFGSRMPWEQVAPPIPKPLPTSPQNQTRSRTAQSLSSRYRDSIAGNLIRYLSLSFVPPPPHHHAEWGEQRVQFTRVGI